MPVLAGAPKRKGGPAFPKQEVLQGKVCYQSQIKPSKGEIRLFNKFFCTGSYRKEQGNP